MLNIFFAKRSTSMLNPHLLYHILPFSTIFSPLDSVEKKTGLLRRGAPYELLQRGGSGRRKCQVGPLGKGGLLGGKKGNKAGNLKGNLRNKMNGTGKPQEKNNKDIKQPLKSLKSKDNGFVELLFKRFLMLTSCFG